MYKQKLTCPDICPTSNQHEQTQTRREERKGSHGNPNASPYVPGLIKPPEPRVTDPGAPPKYLPQPSDTTSGDFLAMGPIGPWAAGHLDWSPHAGTTGVRPVVDKYSITRYSTGEWRKNNEKKLTPTILDKAIRIEKQTKEDKESTFRGIDDKLDESNKMLDKRVTDLSHWKKEVRKAVDAISNEIDILEQYRVRLKGASRILMIPEAISRECLELRTHRYEPDQVRDEAEQELITEVSIVGEIRRIFQNTLSKVENQMVKLKAAKASIEMDWSDKKISLNIDKNNSQVTSDSTVLLYHPGVARWPENTTSLEYWEHFCSESIKNCDDVRKESEELRNDLMTAIVKGSRDMKTQADRTNAALADTIETTQALCDKLEECLKENLQKIADVENLIDDIKESLREVDRRNKCVMTRLHARNYERPNVENCRDEAQHALMSEAKFIKESNVNLLERLREAEFVRLELIKRRGDLEMDIACKRKSLNIDRDRCGRIRAHMPSPEEFEAATLCMVGGVAVYPAGWGDAAVQETCGPAADQYHIGGCHVRWAYLLAVIGCLDGIVLAALAFILATRHVRLQPDTAYPSASLYKGEVNNAYVTDATSMSGSRKSLALQPVLLMPHPHHHPHHVDMDTYSHYSGRTQRSKHGVYANTMHNYQL